MAINPDLRSIIGIKPFDTLPIDAEIWKEAHDHHRQHRSLHARYQHRPGIAYGLEVIAHGTEGNEVLLCPGVATTPDGRTIVVARCKKILLKDLSQSVLVIRYAEPDTKDQIEVDGQKHNYKVREYWDFKQEDATLMPSDPYIELARLERTSAKAKVRDAGDPFEPQANEINLLHRVQAFPYCYASGAIAEIDLVPTSGRPRPNRPGLIHLLREGNGHGFHLHFKTEELSQVPREIPILLYASVKGGFAMPKKEDILVLRQLISSGATLFGDAAEGDAGFAKQFNALAKELEVNLTNVSAKSPLLTSRSLFTVAPNGGQANGSLSADLEGGVILSTSDYGGAWQGQVGAGDRETVRTAQEFGLNIIAWAAQRKRAVSLKGAVDGS